MTGATSDFTMAEGVSSSIVAVKVTGMVSFLEISEEESVSRTSAAFWQEMTDTARSVAANNVLMILFIVLRVKCLVVNGFHSISFSFLWIWTAGKKSVMRLDTYHLTFR